MKTVFKILLFILLPGGLFGQLTPLTNQYILNPLIINPAYAGNRGALNIAAFYRRQWVGIHGAPETTTFAMDAPTLDSKLGLGIIITNDKIGVTRETSLGTNYAYKITMGEGNLALGLGAGIIITNTAWSDLSVSDPGDEYYLLSSRVFVVPDFRFGVYYSNKNYFIGVSIPKLLSSRFDFKRDKYNVRFNPGKYYYLLNTGYVFNLSPKLRFYPSTLVTISPGEKLLYDLNVNFILFDRLWLGTSYRNNYSVTGLMQFAVNNQFRLAYTYDFDFNALQRYNHGSHEIMLRYEFRYKVNVVSPLIF
jgi:type IX secretion system PorP/SprF family membrane protein